MLKPRTFWLECVAVLATTPAVFAQTPAQPNPMPAAPMGQATARDSMYTYCPPGRDRLWRDHIKPCMQYSWWGYADEFCGIPFGARVQSAIKTQVCNGLAGQVVLYRYDFCSGPADSDRLNRHGMKHLDEVVSIMQNCGYAPLVVETSGCAEVDAARKAFILKLLADRGMPAPDASVVVGEPTNPGFAGKEAMLVHETLLKQTGSGGAPPVGRGGVVVGGTAIPTAQSQQP
jgi:hypothetical protein